MKRLILIIMIALTQSGCAISPKEQGQAVRVAADQSTFVGLNKNTKFSVSFPSTHSGPYKYIDQLNFIIEEGQYKDKNASAIIGKSRTTGTWKVLAVMINENGEWMKLPKSD